MISARKMYEWAVFTFVSVLLFEIGTVAQALLIVLVFFYSAPLVALVRRMGAGYGLAGVAVASGIVTLIDGSVVGLVYLLSFGMQGLALGLVARRTTKPSELLLCGFALVLACKLVTVFCFAQATGVNVLALDSAEMKKTMMTVALNRNAALPKDLLDSQINAFVETFVLYMPFIMIVTILIETLATFKMASLIGERTGESRLSILPKMGEFRFPHNLFFALLVGTILEWIGETSEQYAFLRQPGANMVAVALALFIVQGLSVAWYYFDRKRIHWFLRVPLIIIVPMVGILSDAFALLGLMDIWFDLRKRIGRKDA